MQGSTLSSTNPHPITQLPKTEHQQRIPMPETLFLIDAYAQIFRAYYAIRGGMHSPVTSEPTHAVFGMTAMILKLFTQHRPDYVLVAVDAPGKTFRDEIYTEYKGTRNATPDDLT